MTKLLMFDQTVGTWSDGTLPTQCPLCLFACLHARLDRRCPNCDFNLEAYAHYMDTPLDDPLPGDSVPGDRCAEKGPANQSPGHASLAGASLTEIEFGKCVGGGKTLLNLDYAKIERRIVRNHIRQAEAEAKRQRKAEKRRPT